MMVKQSMKTEIEEKFSQLPENSYTKVIIAGDNTELKTLEKKPNTLGLQRIRRLSGNRYCDYETGEIKEYKNNSKRATNPHFRETLQKIKRYINANFCNDGQFATIGYDSAMKDIKIAKKDFGVFLKALRKTKKAIEYLWVIEPKETGSWHFHILFKGDMITAGELQALWVHGNTNIKAIYDVHSLASYLAPNSKIKEDIDNVAAEDENENELENPAEETEYKNNGISILSKSKQKTERFCYYPAGERIYGKSKGIKKWQEIETTRGEAIVYTEGKKKIGEFSLAVVEPETEKKVNQINFEYYKG